MRCKAVIIPAFVLFSIFLSLLSNSEAKLHSGNVARERTARSIQVYGLTDDQRREFTQVLDTVEYYLDFAIKAVDRDTTLFRTWFHRGNEGNAKVTLRNIRNIVKTKTYSRDTSNNCDGSKAKIPIAYIPYRSDTIYLCSAFFTEPLVGTNSRVHSLVHELAHFVIPDQGEDFYGEDEAKLFARTATGALRSPENFGIFVSNVNPFDYKWDSQMQFVPNRLVYVTSGPVYIRLGQNQGKNRSIDPGYPKLLSNLKQEWGIDLPTSFLQGFDAMVTYPNIHIFRGGQYLEFNRANSITNGPYPLTDGHYSSLPANFQQGIDAAFFFGGVYLLKGNQVIKYRFRQRGDPESYPFLLAEGYPKSIEHLSDDSNEFSALPQCFEERIDSAVYDYKFSNSELCLTKGGEILCYAVYHSAGEPVKIKDKYS